ncbi:hypothetical protein GGX14DRAFT_544283 [Mycena pura]|uniref:Uncharacterized protein n=1 Tax=Mycena pura TaxID=153505 RepID=A0AAD6Y9D3_9AGAR|nr:hypothetical protein GGX14DRAFT_544283 [Mycena pura]
MHNGEMCGKMRKIAVDEHYLHLGPPLVENYGVAAPPTKFPPLLRRVISGNSTYVPEGEFAGVLHRGRPGRTCCAGGPAHLQRVFGVRARGWRADCGEHAPGGDPAPRDTRLCRRRVGRRWDNGRATRAAQGAHVVATCSDRTVALVQSLGGLPRERAAASLPCANVCRAAIRNLAQTGPLVNTGNLFGVTIWRAVVNTYVPRIFGGDSSDGMRWSARRPPARAPARMVEERRKNSNCLVHAVTAFGLVSCGDLDLVDHDCNVMAAPQTFLRQRNTAGPAADTLDAEISDYAAKKRDEVVWGKTPSGEGQYRLRPRRNTPTDALTVFRVPTTHDVLTLFHPAYPKSHFDLLNLALLGAQLLLFAVLPRATARAFFLLYFAFWRAAYDAGLGWILTKQSKKTWIVREVQRRGWLDPQRRPATRARIRASE